MKIIFIIGMLLLSGIAYSAPIDEYKSYCENEKFVCDFQDGKIIRIEGFVDELNSTIVAEVEYENGEVSKANFTTYKNGEVTVTTYVTFKNEEPSKVDFIYYENEGVYATGYITYENGEVAETHITTNYSTTIPYEKNVKRKPVETSCTLDDTGNYCVN